jgi:hypothetical protein
MKTYLNREERRIATYFCIVYGLIDGVMKFKDSISKEEVTALKYVNTYLEKYIDALIKRVGPEEGRRIHREAMENKVELKPKNYDGQLIVDKTCMEEVARYAVEGKCFGCERNDWRNCELCHFMHKIGMGRIEDDEMKCEFWFEPLQQYARIDDVLDKAKLNGEYELQDIKAICTTDSGDLEMYNVIRKNKYSQQEG